MTADTSFSLLTGNSIETRRVRAGGVIFREGEQADELYVIKSGYVRIQVGNREMANLTTDSIFGEMALIDSEPRSATAVLLSMLAGIVLFGNGVVVFGRYIGVLSPEKSPALCVRLGTVVTSSKPFFERTPV